MVGGNIGASSPDVGDPFANMSCEILAQSVKNGLRRAQEGSGGTPMGKGAGLSRSGSTLQRRPR